MISTTELMLHGIVVAEVIQSIGLTKRSVLVRGSLWEQLFGRRVGHTETKRSICLSSRSQVFVLLFFDSEEALKQLDSLLVNFFAWVLLELYKNKEGKV